MFQIKGNLRSSVCASSLAECDYSEMYEIHGIQTLQKKIGCFITTEWLPWLQKTVIICEVYFVIRG